MVLRESIDVDLQARKEFLSSGRDEARTKNSQPTLKVLTGIFWVAHQLVTELASRAVEASQLLVVGIITQIFIFKSEHFSASTDEVLHFNIVRRVCKKCLKIIIQKSLPLIHLVISLLLGKL